MMKGKEIGVRIVQRDKNQKPIRTFRLVRDDKALGQEVVTKGVGGRGGREGEDALLAVAQEEVDGQAPALAGSGGGGIAEKGWIMGAACLALWRD